MKNSFRYILMALTASVLLSVLSSCRDSRVIDEEDMAKIYAEMLMTDQWINSTPDVRRIADTSLVYEPILRKYGYSSENYRFSINYYLEHPKEFAEIMKMTVKILDNRKAALQKERERLEEERKIQEYVKSMRSKIELDEELFSIQNTHPDKIGENDSLAVQWDSLSYCFRINRIPRADSLSVADSVSVADTLAKIELLDSLQVLPEIDTLQVVKDTSRKIKTINKLRPLKMDNRLDNKRLHKVKDAYLLNE